MEKIILTDVEPGMNPSSDELARVIVDRLGLNPRKENSTKDMYRTFLEFYERAKQAAQQKNPEYAVITVEEMAIYAKITRQTMYDYLRRWTHLNLIVKTSYIKDGKVIIGYKLNGSTLENAFEKARVKIQNNLDLTQKYVSELQRVLKNEKISKAQRNNNNQFIGRNNQPETEDSGDYSEDEPEQLPQKTAKTRNDAQMHRQPQRDNTEEQDNPVNRQSARQSQPASQQIPVIDMPVQMQQRAQQPQQQAVQQAAQSSQQASQSQQPSASQAPSAPQRIVYDTTKKEVPYVNSDFINFRDNSPVQNVRDGSSEFVLIDKLNNDVVRQSDEKFLSGQDKRKKAKLLNISKIVKDSKSAKDGGIEIVQKNALLDDTMEIDNSGDDYEIDDHDEDKPRITETKGSYEDKNLGIYNDVSNNFG